MKLASVAMVSTTQTTGCVKILARHKRIQGKMQTENWIVHVLDDEHLSLSLYCFCMSNWTEKVFILHPTAKDMVV